MTHDFIEDAIEVLEKSGYPYLIVIECPNGKGAHVRSDIGKWKTGKPYISIREDIHQRLDVTAFNEEETP